MKRILAIVISISLALSLFAQGSATTKITFMNSKGEIQAQLEEAARLFERENPGISIELLAAPVGQSPWEKVMALYAAGNAPTLFMDKITSLLKIKDKLVDLSGERWVKDIIATPAMELATPGGKVIAFPATVEGYGIIYNGSLLGRAGIDPKSIRTIKDLEAAFKKLKAAGIGAVTLAKDDWSVGGHFLYTGYSQAENQANWERMQAELKAGKFDLAKNSAMNGLLDTFDLLKKYNINSADPMSPSYDTVNMQFASGKAAFYFQGNWVWPLLSKLTKETYFGIIPVPVSNDPKDYGNTGIPVSITKFIAIDAEQNSRQQQDAAKKFLEWLVYSPVGQDMIVSKCSIIPAFRNIALTPADPLSQSIIKDYIVKGRTIFWPQTPSDHWAKLGVFMQKYLADVIPRDELLKEIRDYWTRVK
jgi:raffinose/stachyose/melibiose transport system substrate-binding protein